ncbi:MAG: winged helix DNA-binding domain-containing protein, partial [Jiangellaceae bacterium]
MAEKVSKSEVVAFRLNAHHLTKRMGGEGLLEAAGRCGIQNSPPGSALLALHARVRSITQERMAAAIADDKSLLQTWCMRGAPFVFPTVDAAVFTTGVSPPTEEAMRHFIPGVEQTIAQLDISLTKAVELCGAEIDAVLAGRRLAINELGQELARRIASKLTTGQRSVWEGEGPFAPNQPLGEGVVHFCVRILTLQRKICFAPRTGNQAPFVLVEEWLGHAIPDVDPDLARAELLRRYLRGYGPSTRIDFAAWLGIHARDTEPWWDLVHEELTPVEFGGTSWILTEDLDAMRSAPEPEGVRLLPPRDPYTQMRDRETIVDKKRHRELWTTVGEPGAVLVDGKIAGTWRTRKSGRKLTVTIKTFDSTPARDKKLLEDEA